MESFIAIVREERFNPTHPERTAFAKEFGPRYSAYIYERADRKGGPRVVFSAGALMDTKVGDTEVLRDDFSRRYLGVWRVVGVKHYSNGQSSGMIPDKALPLAVFK